MYLLNHLPVSARPLGGQIHPIHAIAVVIHNLGQAKISDFDFSTCRPINQKDIS